MKSPLKLLIIQILIIPLVILIFKFPAEKRWLSLLANSLFIGISILTIRYSGVFKNSIRLSGLQFLIGAVLPVTILRFISWNTDFSTTLFLGVSGYGWHKISNYSFMVMLLFSSAIIILNKCFGPKDK